MIGNNEYVPTPVLTEKGVVDISDLFPGDKVIEYKTSRKIPILNTVKRDLHDIWELEFNDGRKMTVSSVDMVYTGKEIMPIIQVLKQEGKPFDTIHMFPVQFSQDVHAPIFPDPYVGGVLLMYGDYDDEYLNLPLDRIAVNNNFAHKYNLNYAEKLGNNTVYFSWNNTPPENPISWDEFFPKYTMYVKTKQLSDPIFPDDYAYGSLKTREQFVMGIFDMGWDKYMFPDSVCIAHKHEFRLEEFQRVLWSMGLCSSIVYDPNMRSARGREYRLNMLGKSKTYPGPFYDLDALENFILNHNPPEPFNLRVVKAKCTRRGWGYNLLLPQPNLLYLDGNYLPRVSM